MSRWMPYQRLARRLCQCVGRQQPCCRGECVKLGRDALVGRNHDRRDDIGQENACGHQRVSTAAAGTPCSRTTTTYQPAKWEIPPRSQNLMAFRALRIPFRHLCACKLGGITRFSESRDPPWALAASDIRGVLSSTSARTVSRPRLMTVLLRWSPEVPSKVCKRIFSNERLRVSNLLVLTQMIYMYFFEWTRLAGPFSSTAPHAHSSHQEDLERSLLQINKSDVNAANGMSLQLL